MTKDTKMQMTGATALQLIEAMNEAVDAAGSGEWRGLKALQKLRQLGLDVHVTEAPIDVLRQIGTEIARVSSSEAGHG